MKPRKNTILYLFIVRDVESVHGKYNNWTTSFVIPISCDPSFYKIILTYKKYKRKK